eukprot:505501-Amphidinium_carterae.1
MELLQGPYRTWRSTLKRLTRTLRVTLRLNPSGPQQSEALLAKDQNRETLSRRGGSGGTSRASPLLQKRRQMMPSLRQ